MISIIIPTLNEESVLEATLKNLRLLTLFPYEIIISDGKSTDQTLAIAKKYADKIVIYAEEKRQTIANARNIGAKVATGDLYLFLDADVIIPDPNDFFTVLLKAFEERNLVAATVKLRVMAELETRSDRFWFGFINLTGRLNNNVFGQGSAPGEFQIMRKEAYQKVGGYNENLVAAEDYEMFGKLSRIGKTRFLKALLILHTGRRAHVLGWPKLLSQWFGNWFSMLFWKKAMSKEWEIIR